MIFNAKKRQWALAGLLGTFGSGIAQAQQAELQPEKKSVAQSQAVPISQPVPMPEMSTTDLLNLLVSEGVITKEAAIRLVNALRQRAERAQERSTDGAADPQATVVVPYIPPYVEARIAESIKKDLAAQVVEDAKREGFATPEWINKVRLSGDVRVRYNGEFYPSDNPIYGVNDTDAINDEGGTSGAGRDAYINIHDDRHRLLGRARLRVTSNPAENVEVGVRITSGNGGSPVSANQTMGRYGSKWESSFDLAYIQYETSRLLLSGGRMENPWLTTDLVWDRDMTFEGLFAQVSPFRIGKEDHRWNTYINLGAFPLQEIHQFKLPDEALDAPDDKWFYSAGIGSELRFNANHRLDLALTYHDFKNVTGIKNLPGEDSQNPSVPMFFQWGNVTQNIAVSLPGETQEELYGLAGEFEIANFTARYNYSGFGKYQMSFAADYVQNLAWDQEAVSLAAGTLDGDTPGLIPDRDRGYQLEMGFGTQSREKRGDWGASVTYRYLEGDAVLDAFADSDFLMGGTNAQGYIIKAQQYMTENVWLEVTLISADEIDYPISSDFGDVREDAVMLDVSARF